MQPILNTGKICHALSDSTNTKASAIGIIGAGAAGLINAHVLLQDGFSDITLVSRDKSVGGTWARARVYPGLHINKYNGFFLLLAMSF